MAVILPKQVGAEDGKILFQKAEEIKDFEEAKEIDRSLQETIDYYGGAGLAAPQIGISKRIFIVNTDSGRKTYINPKILEFSSEKNIDLEGCLSIFFGSFFGKVERPNFLKIQYFDLDGEKHVEEIKDILHSRVIQHELDHLNGIIFIQKMKEQDFAELYWDQERDIRNKN